MKYSLSVWGLLLLGCAKSGGAGGGHAAVTGLTGDSGASKSDASLASTGGAAQSGNGGASQGGGGASSGGAVGRSSGGASATDSGSHTPDAAGNTGTGGAPMDYWDGSNGCALVDGTLANCGADMTPPGDPKTRYFCSLGTLVATAPCPGQCINDKGARCVVGSGSTTGSITAYKSPSSACVNCRNTNCGSEQDACGADPLCSVVPKCLAGCTGWSGCKQNCREAFGPGPIDDYDEQEACFDTYCHVLCAMSDGG